VKFTILDDYFNTVRTRPCFSSPECRDVTIWKDRVNDTPMLTER
jgi:D-3-phosphoglycerate dehydrogenase / 2-oxoglutarate reductase